MVKKRTKTQSKTELRIVPWILFALILLVIMLAVKIVAEHIEKQRRVAALFEKVRVETVEARQQQTSRVDALHQSRIDLLVEAGVTTPERLYTTKLDTCSLVSASQGWITTGWSQACRLEYTSLVYSHLTREDVLKQLSLQEQTPRLFGDKDDNKYTKVCDELFRLNGARTAYYYDTRLGEDDRARNCRLPGYDKGEAGSTVYAHPISETRVIEAFRADEVDPNKTYIGVFTREEYYRSPGLGCKDDFLFCQAPLEKPMASF